jgi:hypothetical protein
MHSTPFKRAVWILIFAVAIVGCSRHEDRAATERDKDRQVRREKAQEAIRALAASSGADATWKSELIGQSFNPRVYSLDVERVWLRDRPILLIGRLEDVSALDESNYTLTVRSGDLLAPVFALEIVCPISKAEPTVEAVRADRDNLLGGGVAVAARVTAVKSFTEHDGESLRRVFTGYGKCVEVTYVGEIDAFAALRERLPATKSKQ